MNESDDIANLFKQFGGQSGQYQEIGRANDARQSRERWPLLSAMDNSRAEPLPSVQAPERQVSGLAALDATRPQGNLRVESYVAPSRAQDVPSASPAGRNLPPAAPIAEAPAPRPAAEFIAPRPRSAASFAPFERAAVQSAPAPTPAQAAAAAPVPRHAPSAQSGDLQSLFARLARQTEDDARADKNATILQRLSRL